MPSPLDRSPARRLRRAGAAVLAVTMTAAALVSAAVSATAAETPVIAVGASAPAKVRYAAQELQRYLLGVTGTMPAIVADTAVSTAPAFVVGRPADNQILAGMVTAGELTPESGTQGYALKKTTHAGREVLAISGADEEGALYGVYGLLTDYYGMSFTLTGDTFPVPPRALALATVNENKAPRQTVRGVLPWTNFPQSATSYSMRDYAYVIDQMAKSRMNLLNLHNYNGQDDHDEIFANIETNGVRSNTWMATSATGHGWEMSGWNTRDYRFGSADIIDDYASGSDLGLHNERLGVQDVFGKGKAMFQWLLEYAHSRGVRITLGLDLDLIPPIHGQAYNATGVSANRATQLATDYPSLDYLALYRSELMNADQDANWKAEFSTFRTTMAGKGVGTKLAVSGWGLSSAFMTDMPADVIAAPIARYTASFDSGAGFGTREYWGAPWQEQDGSSMYYYAYDSKISTTITAYNAAAANMKGLQTLTWRLGGAIDPKMSYIAKAPWYPLSKYPNSAAVYDEYAKAQYGTAAAATVLPIINENEAYSRAWPECWPTPAPSGADRTAALTKAQQQIATIDTAIGQTTDVGQKARLGKLRARLTALYHHTWLDSKINTTPYAELADHFRPFTEAMLEQVDDVSSLGNIVSTQNRYGQEWLAKREFALDGANAVLAPVNVTARALGTGAVVDWQSIDPAATAFRIFRDGAQVAQVPATASTYTDTTTAGAHSYYVVTVKGAATSQNSVAAPVGTGAANVTAPQVIVTSAPSSVRAGAPLDVTARLVADADNTELAADLYHRQLGATTWTKVSMTNRTRAVFTATVAGSSLGSGVQYYVSAYPKYATTKVGTFPADGAAHPASAVVDVTTTTAPAAPTLTAAGHTLKITPTAGSRFTRIYRSRSATFTADASTYLTELGSGTTTFTEGGMDFDAQPLHGRFHYRAVAVNAAGRPGAATGSVALDLGSGSRTLDVNDALRSGEVHGHNDSHVFGGGILGWFASRDQVLWNAPGTAEYVSLRYSNGWPAAKRVSLFIDGVFRQNLVLAPTGSWDSFATTGVGVHVGRSVMIKVTPADATANGTQHAVNLAGLTLGNQTEQTTEAESGTLTTATTATVATASGASAVNFSATTTGTTIALTGAGTGTAVGIRYANPHNQDIRAGLYAGTTRVATVTFPFTGGAYGTRWVNAAVTGAVSLKIDATDTNPAGTSLSIDYVLVTSTDEGGVASAATRSGGQVVAQAEASGGSTFGYFGDQVGESVTWPLATAVKSITVSYSSIYTNRVVGVFNNGTRVATATFPGTGSWTVYQPLTITGTFAPGTVMFRADQADVTANGGGFCCNIDQLTLNTPQYEAESGAFTGSGVQTFTDANASGGAGVGWFGSVAGDSVTFGAMKSDGLVLRYSNGNPRGTQATVQVNGLSVATVVFPPTKDGWPTYREVQVHVPVNGTVKVVTTAADVTANGGLYVLNLDQISAL